MIRSKFKCTSVEKTESSRFTYDEEADPNHRSPLRDGDGKYIMREKFLYTAKFTAVASNGNENKRFWEASPSGQLQLTSILEDAFQPGQEYYVDFTPADPSQGFPD